MWDYATLPTTSADKKRRVVIPVAHPGDVSDVQQPDEGRVVPVRLNMAATAVSLNAHIPYAQSWSASASYEVCWTSRRAGRAIIPRLSKSR